MIGLALAAPILAATTLAAPTWAVAALASTPSPTSSQGPDPLSVSPGLAGFLATFGLVVACLLLFVSMVRRMRRMQYRAEHDASENPDPPMKRDTPKSPP